MKSRRINRQSSGVRRQREERTEVLASFASGAPCRAQRGPAATRNAHVLDEHSIVVTLSVAHKMPDWMTRVQSSSRTVVIAGQVHRLAQRFVKTIALRGGCCRHPLAIQSRAHRSAYVTGRSAVAKPPTLRTMRSSLSVVRALSEAGWTRSSTAVRAWRPRCPVVSSGLPVSGTDRAPPSSSRPLTTTVRHPTVTGRSEI